MTTIYEDPYHDIREAAAQKKPRKKSNKARFTPPELLPVRSLVNTTIAIAFALVCERHEESGKKSYHFVEDVYDALCDAHRAATKMIPDIDSKLLDSPGKQCRHWHHKNKGLWLERVWELDEISFRVAVVPIAYEVRAMKNLRYFRPPHLFVVQSRRETSDKTIKATHKIEGAYVSVEAANEAAWFLARNTTGSDGRNIVENTKCYVERFSPSGCFNWEFRDTTGDFTAAIVMKQNYIKSMSNSAFYSCDWANIGTQVALCPLLDLGYRNTGYYTRTWE